MSELKYELVVENGDIVREDGSFFKAMPFEVESNGRVISSVFRKADHGHVVYVVSEGEETLLELAHPDYLPEMAFSELDDSLKSILFFYAALLQVGIGKQKWQDYAAVVLESPQSFIVRQFA